MAATTLLDETRLAFDNLVDAARGVVATPTLRLGVTGLARAGKTVFISALVHNLVHGGRLPVFEAASMGRLARAYLQPQPDDAVPRFDYEAHIADLVDRRVWPDSTRRISELRLTIEFESARLLSRALGRGRLHLDIVDYPGEWLLDLALLSRDYATWAAEAVRLSRRADRRSKAGPFLAALAAARPDAAEDEAIARDLAAAFTAYLAAVRASSAMPAVEPPGRFLMPGDLEGSPALTFAPLDIAPGTPVRRGSLAAMMQRRYDAYRDHVVRPFFREHFARLDRQIVLVDVLGALDGGALALSDLERALADILSCFRPGRASFLTSLVRRRIDRVLFAATKADHLHQADHDRLEAILDRLVARARKRAGASGAAIETLALASVRATREGTVTSGGERLPAILGTPMPGEAADGEVFDGQTEIAFFPGDLPDDPESLFSGSDGRGPLVHNLRFVRFRPAKLERTAEGYTLSLPHIRLDRALQFLLGDRLE